MTTDPHDEHGEILRRALHAEAETVTPAGDGLERIRARIATGGGGRRRPGLDWFGLDRFTVNWARPVLAVTAAVAIAGLGVTAPQTIDLIQQSVGSNGPPRGGHHDSEGDRTDAHGHPISPGAPSPAGPSASGTPSASESAVPTTSPGSSACFVSTGVPSHASTTPKSTSADPSASPCPSQTTTSTPTPTPTPTTSKPADPTPTEVPTPQPSSAPSTTSEQGAATTP